MSTEQEALRLADEIERAYRRGYETEDEATIRANNSRREAAAMLRRLVAEREADRAVMREALEALEGATKIIVRVDKGITTLARQEADPLSGLSDVRAAISSLKAKTQ